MITLRSSNISPRLAFAHAISRGTLSRDEAADNFAGNFMFMGEDERGQLVFKNSTTRAYVVVKEKGKV